MTLLTTYDISKLLLKRHVFLIDVSIQGIYLYHLSTPLSKRVLLLVGVGLVWIAYVQLILS